MSLDALSNAVLSTREMDRLTEILTGAPAKRTADRLSSLNRFKKTLIRMLPDAGAALADTIVATRPFKDAEAITRNALSNANSAESEGPADAESGPETAVDPVEATPDAPEAPAHAPEAPIASDVLAVHDAPPVTSQKGKLKRAGTGTPKPRLHRPDGSKIGRLSEFAGKRLYPVKGAKPRRPGTHGERSLKIIQDEPGISYRDFCSKGGRRVDLAWDVDHGKVYVE